MEFWHGKLEGEVSDGPKRVFKKVKTNLPPYPPPKHLSTFLSTSKDEIFLAPLNKAQPNLPEEEQEAMRELVDKQRRGEIKIVPNDKTGGVTVVDLADYKLVVEEQLRATYVAEDGTTQP